MYYYLKFNPDSETFRIAVTDEGKLTLYTDAVVVESKSDVPRGYVPQSELRDVYIGNYEQGIGEFLGYEEMPWWVNPGGERATYEEVEAFEASILQRAEVAMTKRRYFVFSEMDMVEEGAAPEIADIGGAYIPYTRVFYNESDKNEFLSVHPDAYVSFHDQYIGPKPDIIPAKVVPAGKDVHIGRAIANGRKYVEAIAKRNAVIAAGHNFQNSAGQEVENKEPPFAALVFIANGQFTQGLNFADIGGEEILFQTIAMDERTVARIVEENANKGPVYVRELTPEELGDLNVYGRLTPEAYEGHEKGMPDDIIEKVEATMEPEELVFIFSRKASENGTPIQYIAVSPGNERAFTHAVSTRAGRHLEIKESDPEARVQVVAEGPVMTVAA